MNVEKNVILSSKWSDREGALKRHHYLNFKYANRSVFLERVLPNTCNRKA